MTAVHARRSPGPHAALAPGRTCAAPTTEPSQASLWHAWDMPGPGVSVVEDASLGAWIAPRLGGEFGAVTRVVPSGYQAYARICHPPSDTSGRSVSWSDVASATTRTTHPLMQWHALVGSSDPFNFTGSLWPGGNPECGNLAPRPLEILCEILGEHTTDAGRCIFGVWSGWSWVGDGGLARCTEPVGTIADPLGRPRLVLSGTDFDSTLIGGSSDLMDAILDAPGLDAWRVSPADSLAADADRINAVG